MAKNMESRYGCLFVRELNEQLEASSDVVMEKQNGSLG